MEQWLMKTSKLLDLIWLKGKRTHFFPRWTRRNTILLLTHVQLVFTVTFIFHFLLTLDASCHMSVHDKYLFALQKHNNQQSCQHADILSAVLSSATWKGHNTSKVKQYLRKWITLNLAASVNYDWYDWTHACLVLSQIPVGSIAL